MLQSVFRARISEDQPAIKALLSEGATAIYPLPCGGPIAFAGTREQSSAMREEYGSNQWTLRFLLLVRSSPEQESLECDLPIAIHNTEERSLISHTTGKRANTQFKKLLTGKTLELWEARTSYLRPDQIRLHAAESGIRVAGESLYGDHDPISRPDLPGTRKPGGRGYVLFPAPAIHLVELSAPSLRDKPFTSSPPKAFLKWMRAVLPEEKDLQQVLNAL
tara:strand:+ start:7124 stop:7783 length:660 start_codon:yes stop_codon:yes gene_type:complete